MGEIYRDMMAWIRQSSAMMSLAAAVFWILFLDMVLLWQGSSLHYWLGVPFPDTAAALRDASLGVLLGGALFALAAWRIGLPLVGSARFWVASEASYRLAQLAEWLFPSAEEASRSPGRSTTRPGWRKVHLHSALHEAAVQGNAVLERYARARLRAREDEERLRQVLAAVPLLLLAGWWLAGPGAASMGSLAFAWFDGLGNVAQHATVLVLIPVGIVCTHAVLEEESWDGDHIELPPSEAGAAGHGHDDPH